MQKSLFLPLNYKFFKIVISLSILTMSINAKTQTLDAATAGAISGAISSNPALFNVRIAPNISFGNQNANTSQVNSVPSAPNIGNTEQGAAVPQIGTPNASGKATLNTNTNTPAVKKTEPLVQDIGYNEKLAEEALRSQSTVVPTGLENINKTAIDYYSKFGQENEQRMLMQGPNRQ